MRDVGMAFVQVLHAGSEAQVAEAGKVLAETRRALYRILADGEPAAEEPSERADGRRGRAAGPTARPAGTGARPR